MVFYWLLLFFSHLVIYKRQPTPAGIGTPGWTQLYDVWQFYTIAFVTVLCNMALCTCLHLVLPVGIWKRLAFLPALIELQIVAYQIKRTLASPYIQPRHGDAIFWTSLSHGCNLLWFSFTFVWRAYVRHWWNWGLISFLFAAICFLFGIDMTLLYKRTAANKKWWWWQRTIIGIVELALCVFLNVVAEHTPFPVSGFFIYASTPTNGTTREGAAMELVRDVWCDWNIKNIQPYSAAPGNHMPEFDTLGDWGLDPASKQIWMTFTDDMAIGRYQYTVDMYCGNWPIHSLTRCLSYVCVDTSDQPLLPHCGTNYCGDVPPPTWSIFLGVVLPLGAFIWFCCVIQCIGERNETVNAGPAEVTAPAPTTPCWQPLVAQQSC
eukprot:TRINITY_DN52604_c0_g2_i1.p1 TRINITY_DN52604_c0_g2~~TRINITY_DN52604_c0_g2_i1.p1  ORF type:complete len:377 (+),score=-14.05 TRINITY_DN52604_c0_g2_i1:63-1193(+)